jgi:IclR family transcriptional regulator, acetate operon repressor
MFGYREQDRIRATVTTTESTPTPGRGPNGSPRYRVGSVARALTILDLVADGPSEGLTLSDAARGLGISKSATYALVRTLVDADFLRAVDPGPRYLLGMALIRLGDVATLGVPLRQICEPVLAEMVRDTGLTCRAAVATEGFPVFVARVDAHGAIRFNAPLGVREMPHTSSAGKAILANLPDDIVNRVLEETGMPTSTDKTITNPHDLAIDLEVTRRRGYAIDDEEDAEGVFCVGAPFFDHAGRVAGALSATGIKRDLPAHRIAELGLRVRAAADLVTGLMGGTIPPKEPHA